MEEARAARVFGVKRCRGSSFTSRAFGLVLKSLVMLWSSGSGSKKYELEVWVSPTKYLKPEPAVHPFKMFLGVWADSARSRVHRRLGFRASDFAKYNTRS